MEDLPDFGRDSSGGQLSFETENGETPALQPYIGPPRDGRSLLDNAIQRMIKNVSAPSLIDSLLSQNWDDPTNINASNPEGLRTQNIVASEEGISNSYISAAGLEGNHENRSVCSFDTDSEEDDGSRFRAIEARFNSLVAPSMEETVTFEIEKNREASRRKIQERRRAAEAQEQEENHDVFGESDASIDSPDDLVSAKQAGADGKPKRMRTTRAMISPRNYEKAKEIGLRAMIGINALTKKLYQNCTIQDTENNQHNDNKHRLTANEVQEICLGPFNVVAASERNALLPELVHPSQTNRDRALAEIVATIPTEGRAEALSDQRKIKEAAKNFDNKIRYAGEGLWSLKGLKTKLHHHQVVGVAWMRERERSKRPPHGGLLCDIMGFGKTISALANILDGRTLDPTETRTATLVVVPNHLVNHWMKQIDLHCETRTFGTTHHYNRKTDTGFNLENDIMKMMSYKVVITTYGDVVRSYPTPKRPEDKESDEEVTRWWSDFYDSHVGLLHQVHWHRIVLDEGHVIRNHKSQTSIAIRALTGRYKWILSGTPLHNCIEELWPYFCFLREENSALFDKFQRIYNPKGHGDSRGRLINKIRAILFRRTHDSKLFGIPIVQMPKIKEASVKVELCQAERLIYDKAKQFFIDSINNLADVEDMKQQGRCILTMILKLRMLTSHLLTAQDIVQHVLTEREMEELTSLEANDDTTDDISREITRLLRFVKDGSIRSSAPLQRMHQLRKVHSSGDVHKLAQNYWELIDTLQVYGETEEYNERIRCAWCEQIPDKALVTSCRHLYCEECFYTLPEKEGNTKEGESDTKFPICRSCGVIIEKVAYYGAFDNIKGIAAHTSESSEGKRKKSSSAGPMSKRRKLKKQPSQYGMFRAPSNSTADNSSDISSSKENDQEDWMEIIGSNMPGSKINKTRDIIKKWFQDEDDAKVVIFSEFQNSIKLLKWMCEREKWECRQISGVVPLETRIATIEDFQTNPDIKVMIASLKTGGVGIDFSAANKCIVLDLWWNKAIQYQAVCRLYRIGQHRDVEFVMVIANDTIDEHILELQNRKEGKIREFISLKALGRRDSIKQLLEYFGAVEMMKGGRFKIAHSCERKSKLTDKPKE